MGGEIYFAKTEGRKTEEGKIERVAEGQVKTLRCYKQASVAHRLVSWLFIQ